jgi:hypothetical protein
MPLVGVTCGVRDPYCVLSLPLHLPDLGGVFKLAYRLETPLCVIILSIIAMKSGNCAASKRCVTRVSSQRYLWPIRLYSCP